MKIQFQVGENKNNHVFNFNLGALRDVLKALKDVSDDDPLEALYIYGYYGLNAARAGTYTREQSDAVLNEFDDEQLEEFWGAIMKSNGIVGNMVASGTGANQKIAEKLKKE